MDTLELLLNKKPTTLPETTIKNRRLSQECGEDVIFRLKGLSYDISHEISTLHQNDTSSFTVLAGVVDPIFKDKGLMEKYNAASPIELIKKMFLHGEVIAMAREIERLTGFRTSTFEIVEDIKKK